jgi:hypothetical protein
VRAQDNKSFANVSVSPASFPLIGGNYGVDCIATFGGGSVDLQKVAGDGATLVDVGTATKFTANGYATQQLPPGNYKVTVTTATAVYVDISLIPTD